MPEQLSLDKYTCPVIQGKKKEGQKNWTTRAFVLLIDNNAYICIQLPPSLHQIIVSIGTTVSAHDKAS